MKKLILTGALICAASSSFASSTGVYVGADYTLYNAKNGGTSLNFGALGVTGGYKFNENIAVEGRAAVGANDDHINGVNVGLNNYVGAQGVASYPLGSGLSAYGTLGYGRVELKASAGNSYATASDSGVSYGAGIQVKANRVGFRLGIESLFDKQGTQITGLRLQGLYSF